MDRNDPLIRALGERLPNVSEGIAIAEELALRWGLRLGAVFPGASYCLVVAADDEAVLRVPLSEEESGPGYHAQLAFSGRGGVRILKHDPATGSTLMVRMWPGTMLSDAGLQPEDEARAACKVMQKLDGEPFPEAMTVAGWFEPFLKLNEAEGIPDELFRVAQKLASQMLATAPQDRLLHGDLHHFNLLRHGDEWISIDPKGVLGEPAFEPAAFLRNPFTTIYDTADLPGLMATRIRTFAEGLGQPAQRIWAWGVAQNTLSAWWCPPDERPRPMTLVEAIRQAKP